MMPREPGLSVRLKLTLSYVGFLMVAGALLLTAVWVFLLRNEPASRFLPRLSDLTRVTIDPRNFGPAAFGSAAVTLMVLLLVFGSIAGWFLAGRMLAPLDRVTAATRRAAGGSLSHRVALEGRSDEFRELADAFDAMLTRLEAHVAEQQRFAANASHELRTPLAITQTLLDVARAEPGRQDAELLDRLHLVNTRAIELTEALLVLSRASQGSFVREPVDLSLLAEEASETLLPLAEDGGVTVTVAGEPAVASGSRALLLQLTTNLVHNALVHNLPAGGHVWVTTRVDDDGGAVLTVENTGARLTPAVVATLTEPFQRGAERVATEHGGVGLGLAIVKSIALAHGGRVDLRPREDGGLLAVVSGLSAR